MNFEKFENILLVIGIAILYTGLMFYGLHVFIGEPKNDCYKLYPYDINGKRTQEDFDKCYDKYEKALEKSRQIKLLILTIVNIIVFLIAWYFKYKPLFFGTLLTAIIGTIVYFDSESILGFFILLLYFILFVIFVKNK